jgi:hypothetical protein
MAESTEYGPDRFSVRRGDLKVVLTPAPRQANSGIPLAGVRPLEVFDLAADRGEQHDLSPGMPTGAAELVGMLWRRVERLAKAPGKNEGGQDLPEELQEQLRSLGYIR